MDLRISPPSTAMTVLYSHIIFLILHFSCRHTLRLHLYIQLHLWCLYHSHFLDPTHLKEGISKVCSDIPHFGFMAWMQSKWVFPSNTKYHALWLCGSSFAWFLVCTAEITSHFSAFAWHTGECQQSEMRQTPSPRQTQASHLCWVKLAFPEGIPGQTRPWGDSRHLPCSSPVFLPGQASGVCFLALSLILSYEVTAEQLISPSPSDLVSLKGDCVKGKTRPRNPYWIIPLILGIFLNKQKLSKKNVSTRSQRVVSSGGSNNESGIGFLHTGLTCLCLNEDELNAWKTQSLNTGV